MDYMKVAVELGLGASCSGDSTILKNITWSGAKPIKAQMDAAWVVCQTKESNMRIKQQIEALDTKRIRPLAEGDTAYLATLNTKIAALRATLK